MHNISSQRVWAKKIVDEPHYNIILLKNSYKLKIAVLRMFVDNIIIFVDLLILKLLLGIVVVTNLGDWSTYFSIRILFNVIKQPLSFVNYVSEI